MQAGSPHPPTPPRHRLQVGADTLSSHRKSQVSVSNTTLAIHQQTLSAPPSNRTPNRYFSPPPPLPSLRVRPPQPTPASAHSPQAASDPCRTGSLRVTHSSPPTAVGSPWDAHSALHYPPRPLRPPISPVPLPVHPTLAAWPGCHCSGTSHLLGLYPEFSPPHFPSPSTPHHPLVSYGSSPLFPDHPT